MTRGLKFVVLVWMNSCCARCVPPSPTSAVTDMLQGEFATLKNTIEVLSDQWEKWNTLFLTSLEPRITSTASTLASIDSNIHNLQERAHVWDTFQLHVSAWNEQLASFDRKLDIISKGQEKILSLDGKINAILSIEYKLDNTIKILNNLYDAVTNMDSKKTHDTLFSEFATRGVLSSIKMVEKKLDRLLTAGQYAASKPNNRVSQSDEKPKLTIKCDSPRIVEDLLNDISSKVDVIFDTVSNSNDDEDDYDYLEAKDAKNKRLKKSARKSCAPFKQTNRALDEILNRAIRIENASAILLDKETTHFQWLSKQLGPLPEERFAQFVTATNLVIDGYFSEQKSLFDKWNKKCCALKADESETQEVVTTTTLFDIETSTKPSIPEDFQPIWMPIANRNKSSCEDLVDGDASSGVYIFENNVSGRQGAELFFNKRYCEIRDDGSWTVIQRRDNYTLQHNFNASWEDYKYGFGDLHRDFWIGNDFLYEMSKRIELKDFEDNAVWAEYDTFAVGAERSNYRLTVGGYNGNASDSFASHDGSLFSTYDRTNDAAPECCPCSVSYGGGWWFSRCFEANLNGIYYKHPHENHYFRGIIWEHWLGNYSLKKSVMMVKPNGPPRYRDPTSTEIPTTETIPYYEDP